MNKSNFSVNVNDLYNGTNTINIAESLNYPCTGCITLDNKIKPYFSYNITDERCTKNKNEYINKIEIEKILTYEEDPLITSLESCINQYNSLYSFITGRYIRISKPTNGYKLSLISVHGRNYIESTITPFIFTTLDNTINYPSKLISTTIANSYNSSYINNVTSNTIILDLISDKIIGFIDFVDFGYNNPNLTLTGATIEVLDQNKTVIYQRLISDNDKVLRADYANITIENKPTLPSNYGTDFYYRRIMMNKKPPAILNTVRTVTTDFDYPCTGCLTDYSCSGTSGCLIKDYKYNNPSSGRCFIPNEFIDKSILDNALLSTDPVPSTLRSCSLQFDTTARLPMGRFIRITITAVNTPLKLYKFYVNDINSNFIRPIDYTIYPSIPNNSSYGILLTDAIKTNTTSIETGQSTTVNSYIQIDLGYVDGVSTLYAIKEVVIVPTEVPIPTELSVKILNGSANIVSEFFINSTNYN